MLSGRNLLSSPRTRRTAFEKAGGWLDGGRGGAGRCCCYSQTRNLFSTNCHSNQPQGKPLLSSSSENSRGMMMLISLSSRSSLNNSKRGFVRMAGINSNGGGSGGGGISMTEEEAANLDATSLNSVLVLDETFPLHNHPRNVDHEYEGGIIQEQDVDLEEGEEATEEEVAEGNYTITKEEMFELRESTAPFSLKSYLRACTLNDLVSWIHNPPELASQASMVYAIYNALYTSGSLTDLQADDHTAVLGIIAFHKSPAILSTFVPRYIENMIQTCKYKLDVRDHHLILEIYFRAQKWDQVQEHFDAMKSIYHVTSPSVKSFNYLMASYMEKGDLRGVIASWKAMVTVWPAAKFLNQEGWAYLIEGHGRAGLIREAEKSFSLISKMVNTNSNAELLDSCVFEAMIRCCGYAGVDKMPIAIELFEALNLKGLAAKKINLESSLNRAGSGFGGIRELVTLKKEEEKRIASLFTSYDSIINACIDSNMPQKALEYFDQIQETCEDLNKAFQVKKKRRKITINLKEDLVNSANEPRFQTPLISTISSILAIHQKNHTHEGQEAFLSLYEAYFFEVSFDTVLNESVFWIYWNRGQKDIALLLYDWMLLKFNTPTIRLANTVLNAKQSQSDHDVW